MGEVLKTLAGKIATGAISLAVVSAALAWYETDPQTRHQILSGTGRILGWMMLVLIAPWAAFAIIAWVSRLQSNFAGAVLVVMLTFAQALVLAWLLGWSVGGATRWVLYIAAILMAGVYNLFTSDWIAEKME